MSQVSRDKFCLVEKVVNVLEDFIERAAQGTAAFSGGWGNGVGSKQLILLKNDWAILWAIFWAPFAWPVRVRAD